MNDPNPSAIIKALCLLMLCSLVSIPTAGAHSWHSHGTDITKNHHVIDARLQTGGAFTDGGLDTLADEGVSVIIDLRDAPPDGQAERLAEKGIAWVNVPVSFQDPTPADFEAFSAAMAQHRDEKVLVQCDANFRASAMTYLYRVKVEGESPRSAGKDLEAVWQPAGRWQRYIETMLNQP